MKEWVIYLQESDELVITNADSRYKRIGVQRMLSVKVRHWLNIPYKDQHFVVLGEL